MQKAGGPLKVEDALSYLEKVKTQFEKSPQVYNQFLEIMKNFKSQAIDTPEVIQRVSNLFHGHNDLILGFNRFLPAGFRISIPETPEGGNPKAPVMTQTSTSQSSQHPAEFNHAIRYVTSIKERYGSQPGVYKEFLEILHAYQHKQCDIKNVLEKVSKLFLNEPDLLRKFSYFLPEAVHHDDRANSSPAPRKRRAKRPRENDDLYSDERIRTKRRARVRLEEDADWQLPPEQRKFFESVKAALNAGSAWSEFYRLCSLYAEDVGILCVAALMDGQAISRGDLVMLASDVLGGPTGNSNFELQKEFKQMLSSLHAADPSSRFPLRVPTSEIDFNNCRPCTDSYRALPDDYPIPVCSERTPLDKKVLNNIWVSVPTGSEDFSFARYRRNQYEEALFRCEDERYLVDMIIDNCRATINVLDPLAEEITQLRASDATGQWQYKLDSRTLGVLHLKAISRVYGERGEEVLELLRKNPAGAIPVILHRLKAKEREWKGARNKLNEGWKKVLQQNYPRSLDHRSFYFKGTDKKMCSSKTLVAQVKAVRAPAEPEDLESGHYSSVEGLTAVDGKLSFQLPPERIRLMMFSLLSHAAEKALSDVEKGPVADLWLGCLSDLLRLSPKQMAKQRTAIPGMAGIGSTVSSYFGTGIVTGYQKCSAASPHSPWNTVYVVKIEHSYCTAYLRQDEVEIVENPMADAGMLADSWVERGEAQGLRPLATVSVEGGKPQKPLPDTLRLFYGNTPIYVFVRLFLILCQRLMLAEQLAKSAAVKLRDVPVSPAAVASGGPQSSPTSSGPLSESTPPPMSPTQKRPSVLMAKNADDLFNGFLNALYCLLDQALPQPSFEDECRTLLGTNSYPLFTLDKLLPSAVKLLAQFATGPVCRRLRDLYLYERCRSVRNPRLYLGNAHVVLLGAEINGQECFSIETTAPLGEDSMDVEGQGADGTVVFQYVSPESVPPVEATLNPMGGDSAVNMVDELLSKVPPDTTDGTLFLQWNADVASLALSGGLSPTSAMKRKKKGGSTTPTSSSSKPEAAMDVAAAKKVMLKDQVCALDHGLGFVRNHSELRVRLSAEDHRMCFVNGGTDFFQRIERDKLPGMTRKSSKEERFAVFSRNLVECAKRVGK